MDFSEKLRQMEPDKMMENAQHIWQMLDELATSDPQGYKKFIDKQMKEGREWNEPPAPHMCVQTAILKPERDILFINIFEWKRVPEPKSDEDPIPVMSGAVYKGKDDSGTYSIVTVAFCPRVLVEFGVHSALTAERNLLINLAIDFLQDTQKLNISRHFTVLEKLQYKGSLQKARQTLTAKMNKSDKDFHQELGKLEETFVGGQMGAGGSLLDQLSHITSGNSEKSSECEYVLDDPVSDTNKSSDKPVINMPLGGVSVTRDSGTAAKATKKLIQEVQDDDLKDSEQLPTPEFEKRTDDGTVTVKVRLPGVTSVTECQLDISQSDVSLTVTGKYQLTLPLDIDVDQDNAAAKFSKKSSVLTLVLPKL